MEKRKIIAIVGPTASGKTGWGVSVAKKFDGEIISADSRQIYRGLNIGTGKEGINNSKVKTQKSKLQLKSQKLENLAKNIRYIDNIPQWLIDIVNPEEKFTMFDWLERAKIITEEIFSRGKLPILVGGTGLYVQSLVEGFELTQKSKLKSQNCNSKVKIYKREELEKKSLKQLQRIYSKYSFLNPHLDLHNPHRLIRAIERVQAGEVVSKKKPDFEVLQIAVDLPREELYKRIDKRVDYWFEQGFGGEVQGLLSSGVDPKWLEKIGLEYKILTEFLLKNQKTQKLKNNMVIQQYSNESFDEMRQKMKYAIHAYARRQLTWFRRFPEIIWRRDLKSAEKEIRKFLL